MPMLKIAAVGAVAVLAIIAFAVAVHERSPLSIPALGLALLATIDAAGRLTRKK